MVFRSLYVAAGAATFTLAEVSPYVKPPVHHLKTSVAAPPFTREEFTEVFLGIAEGFGLSLVASCVEDSLDFAQEMETAVGKFETQKDEEILAGLEIVSVAVTHTLPKAIRECGATYSQVATILKALSAFASPETFAYHAGHDLLINGVDIFKAINAGIGSWKGQKYEDFGRSIGTALSLIILGCPKPATTPYSGTMANPNVGVHFTAPVFAPVSAPVHAKLSTVHPVEILINTDLQGPRKQGLLFRVPVGPNATSVTPLAIDFTKGLFAGFGTPLTDACVSEDEVLSKMIDAAAKAAAGGSIAGISIAMEILVRAYKLQLPKLQKECGPEVQEAVTEVESALESVTSPQEFLWYVEKNIQINRVEIMEEIQNFSMDIPQGKFEDAGENIGKLLKQVLIASQKVVKLESEDGADDLLAGKEVNNGADGKWGMVKNFMSVFV